MLSMVLSDWPKKSSKDTPSGFRRQNTKSRYTCTAGTAAMPPLASQQSKPVFS